jgi:hypothetical protein
MIDFAIKFEHEYEPSEHDVVARRLYDREEVQKRKRRRQDVVRAIKFSGLNVVQKQSTARDAQGRPLAWYLLISASQQLLEAEATRTKMDKKLQERFRDHEADAVSYAPYDSARSNLYQPSKYTGFFTSLERQRCILTKLEALLTHGGAGLNLDRMRNNGVISDWTFMPNEREEADLLSGWIHSYFAKAPVHDVRNYTGEKIGFYFAFVDHYVRFLTPLSVVSTAVFIYQLYLSGVAAARAFCAGASATAPATRAPDRAGAHP